MAQQILQMPGGQEGFILSLAPGQVVHAATHRHEELELNVVLQGRAKYLLENQTYDLSPGCLLWLFPDQEHWLVDASADFSMWVVVFSRTLLCNVFRVEQDHTLLSRNPSGSFTRLIPDPLLVPLKVLLSDLTTCAKDPDRFNTGLAWLLVEGWRIYEQGGQMTTSVQSHPAVTTCLRLLDTQTEDLDLEALAKTCGISPGRLSRLFSQHVGQSLVKYRQRQCLNHMLAMRSAHPKRKLLSLALDAGFGSYAQFHRACVWHLGQSPRKVFRSPTFDQGATSK
jgi:quercetin dioxygenase-like cupin family protein